MSYKLDQYKGKVYGGSLDGQMRIESDPYISIAVQSEDLSRIYTEYYEYKIATQTIQSSVEEYTIIYGYWVYSNVSQKQPEPDMKELTPVKIITHEPDFIKDFERWFNKRIAIYYSNSWQASVKRLMLFKLKCLTDTNFRNKMGFK